jgi:ribosomal protein S18 acetylase RimI-like enzyme
MNANNIIIRRLISNKHGDNLNLTHSDDWKLWKSLRIEGSQLNPDAFDNTLEELNGFDDAYYQEVLHENVVFGAFDGDELVGGLGFAPGQIAKQRHRGEIFNVFLKPKCRGKGVGKMLFSHVINYVKNERPETMQLHLSVGTFNSPAVGLYQSVGFQVYATEERRLRASDGIGFIDEFLMIYKISRD